MNAPLEPGPTTRRRQLAHQLRELREGAGIRTIKEAAERSGLSDATISRIENAKQVILPRTVRLLCQTYGVGAPLLDYLLRLTEESENRGWMLAYSDTTPNWFSRYLAEEAEAETIWTFENAFVPGLLQTADYCRAVAVASRPQADEEDLNRSVDFRLSRQRVLEDRRVAYHAIVSEAALHQSVGGDQVMRDQIAHLIRIVVEKPNVTLQVIPYEAGAHPGMVGAFVMLHFPAGAQPTIFVEVDSGAIYPDRPVDFERYTWVWQELSEKALTIDDTVHWLDRLAQR